MNIFFGSLAIIISIVITLPYIRDIHKGKTKPHTHSWLPWTILTGIACVIQIKNGEDIWGAGAMGTSAIICAYIYILSLKYGEKNITLSDTLSLISSCILIVLWIFTKNDLLAIVLVCLIDSFAFYPTWRKSWKKPQEENMSMYYLSSFKNLLSIVSLSNLTLVNWLYPLFLFVANGSFALYLIGRRKVIKK